MIQSPVFKPINQLRLVPVSRKGAAQTPSKSSKNDNRQTSPTKFGTNTKKVSVTPVKPGKRRIQAIQSPITTRTESLSPKAKHQSVEKNEIPSRVSRKSPTLVNKVSLSNNENSSELVTKLAVPTVSAVPPSPSQLPLPPKHWVATDSMQCHAKMQQCRAATETLVTMLSTPCITVG